MTKAEQIRSTVLEAINNGASEEEAARAAGIEEERVQRILDSLEWTPPPPPEEKQPRKVVMPRSVHRSVKYTDKRPAKPAAPRKPPAPKRVRNSISEHGTRAGYNAHHTGPNKTPICEPCRAALKERSAQRTHDKRERFLTKDAVIEHLAATGKWADVEHCKVCSYWHAVPKRRSPTPEEVLERKRESHHRKRQEKLDRLAAYRVDSREPSEQRMPMSTTRAEIQEVLTANLWTVLVEDGTHLVATWRNRKIAMLFDRNDRICGLVTERPAPFNGADIQTPILTHRKEAALKFIRGE